MGAIITLFGFVVYIGLAFLIGAWCREKNVGFLGGFLISLILSPIVGVVVAAVAAPKPVKIASWEKVKRKDPVEKPRAAFTLHKCRHCGFGHERKFTFCEACGKDRSGMTQAEYKARAQGA